jgi:hypothetical protein
MHHWRTLTVQLKEFVKIYFEIDWGWVLLAPHHRFEDIPVAEDRRVAV